MLNRQMPNGLEVNEITPNHGVIPQHVVSHYRISLDRPLTDKEEGRLSDFLNATAFTVERSRKGKIKEIDIRPLVVTLKRESEDILSLQLISRATEAGVKPLEALEAILARGHEDLLSAEVVKTGWQELKDEQQG